MATFPPTLPPNNRVDGTASATNHAADHNKLTNGVQSVVERLNLSVKGFGLRNSGFSLGPLEYVQPGVDGSTSIRTATVGDKIWLVNSDMDASTEGGIYTVVSGAWTRDTIQPVPGMAITLTMDLALLDPSVIGMWDIQTLNITDDGFGGIMALPPTSLGVAAVASMYVHKSYTQVAATTWDIPGVGALHPNETLVEVVNTSTGDRYRPDTVTADNATDTLFGAWTRDFHLTFSSAPPAGTYKVIFHGQRFRD